MTDIYSSRKALIEGLINIIDDVLLLKLGMLPEMGSELMANTTDLSENSQTYCMLHESCSIQICNLIAQYLAGNKLKRCKRTVI